MKAKEREKVIEELVRLTWASLESHLSGTHSKTPEGEKFHKECIQDYARMIKLLSELY